MDQLIGQSIISIRGKLFNRQAPLFEKIVILFTSDSLTIEVYSDSDEIILTSSKSNASEESEMEPVSVSDFDYTDKKIISLWQASNHMGYSDLFVLGVESFLPSLLFCSAASQIFIRTFK